MRETTLGSSAFGSGAHRLVEHVVDPEAHADVALEGLDVDVARALLDRLLEQRVHQPDDRRLVGGLEQVLRLGADLAGEGGEVLVGVLDDVGDRVGAAVVDLVDRGEDLAAAGELGLDLDAVEEQAQVVEGVGVEGIGDRDAQRAAAAVMPSGSRLAPFAKAIGTRSTSSASTSSGVSAGRTGRPSWRPSASSISSSLRKPSATTACDQPLAGLLAPAHARPRAARASAACSRSRKSRERERARAGAAAARAHSSSSVASSSGRLDHDRRREPEGAAMASDAPRGLVQRPRTGRARIS